VFPQHRCTTLETEVPGTAKPNARKDYRSTTPGRTSQARLLLDGSKWEGMKVQEGVKLRDRTDPKLRDHNQLQPQEKNEQREVCPS